MSPYLFINPKAGLLKGCQTADEVKEQLSGLKAEPDITIGQDTADIEKFIDKVKQDKPDQVYVAGGDGTLATVIKGLMNEDVTIGLIPTGSMNNIAKSIGIGDELDDAVQVINQGRVEAMDLGRINGEVFIESVGIGLVAQIMDRVGEQDSKKEVFKIIRNTIAEIVTTDTISVKMTVDGQQMDLDTVWLTVTNTGRACAVTVDPEADVHDRRLEVVYCEPLDATEVRKYILSFIKDSLAEEEKFHRYRAERFELELPPDIKVHVDGVLHDWRKLSIEVVPSAIKVFVP